MNTNDAFALAIRYLQTGDLKEAGNICQKIFELQPDDINATFFIAGIFFQIGSALQQKGLLDEAIYYYQKAIQIDPSIADTYYQLGQLYEKKGLLDEAITCYKKALELNSEYIEAYYNFVDTIKKKVELQNDADLYKESIRLIPNHAESHLHLGVVFEESGLLDEAIICYEKALLLNPSIDGAHGQYLLALFQTGNLRKALDNWRWEKVHSYGYFNRPLWDGTNIKGRTILLYGGTYGDEIQFIRYAPMVAECGAKIIFICLKELVSLLKTAKGIHQIITSDEPLPDFDLQCSIRSLPMVFNTSPETVPAKVPYIAVDTSLIKKWRGKVIHNNSKLSIGLVWASGVGLSTQRKSLYLAQFYPLTKLRDITFFYSLQKGEFARDAKNPPEGMKLIDYTEEIKDFADTAAFIENLDLIISVDTAVTHLTGALGKPIWNLLDFNSDWRWLKGRKDSPWYPTMRLFRQTSTGDWKSVISEVKDELIKLLDKN